MWLKLSTRQLFIVILISLLLGTSIAAIAKYIQFANQRLIDASASDASSTLLITNRPSSKTQLPLTNRPPLLIVHATATPQPVSSNNQASQIQISAPASNPTIPPNAANAKSANNQSIEMYVTSYGYDDNDDGHGHFGTAAIAYAKKDGSPTLHSIATEGSGTYHDPITFAATSKDINAGIFPVGSIIYAPYLEKYFILEDVCASCGNDLQGMQYHIDLWMGPSSTSDQTALDNCESKITRNTNIMLKPTTDLVVDTTPLFQNNQCTAHIHE